MTKTFKCKNKKCHSKGKPQTKIGIQSDCTQEYGLQSGEYANLNVTDTQHGYCLECGVLVDPTALAKLGVDQ